MDEIEGKASGLGAFKVSFGEVQSEAAEFHFYENYVNSLKDIHDNAMRRLGGKYVKVQGNQVEGDKNFEKFYYLFNFAIKLMSFQSLSLNFKIVLGK